MPLYDEVLAVMRKVIGTDAEKVLLDFQDPKAYPQDFLDSSVYFFARIAGAGESMRIFEYIAKKYHLRLHLQTS